MFKCNFYRVKNVKKERSHQESNPPTNCPIVQMDSFPTMDACANGVPFEEPCDCLRCTRHRPLPEHMDTSTSLLLSPTCPPTHQPTCLFKVPLSSAVGPSQVFSPLPCIQWPRIPPCRRACCVLPSALQEEQESRVGHAARVAAG